MTENIVIEALRSRYATKKFNPNQKIEDSLWKTLEEVLVLSPSSFGLQPWKFLVVTSNEMKAKLKPVSWNQAQVTDCSHFLVFAARQEMDENYVQKYIERIANVRSLDPSSLTAYKEMMVGSINGPLKSQIFEWTSRQAYIALGGLMTAAALLKIDTCPMEGFEREKYDEILGLKSGLYRSVVACAVGYRSSDDIYAKTPKVRFDTNDLIQRF